MDPLKTKSMVPVWTERLRIPVRQLTLLLSTGEQSQILLIKSAGTRWVTGSQPAGGFTARGHQKDHGANHPVQCTQASLGETSPVLSLSLDKPELKPPRLDRKWNCCWSLKKCIKQIYTYSHPSAEGLPFFLLWVAWETLFPWNFDCKIKVKRLIRTGILLLRTTSEV